MAEGRGRSAGNAAVKKEYFMVKVFDQSPTLYHIEEADSVLELHADGDHDKGKQGVIVILLYHLGN